MAGSAVAGVAAVGGIGVMWLLTALFVPAGVITIPLGLATLLAAGWLRRRLRDEKPIREHLRENVPLDFHARYGPYIVTALGVSVVLWFGTMLVGSGSACHDAARGECASSGSAVWSLVRIATLTVGVGLAINLGYRFRPERPRPGWLISVPAGVLLCGAIVASYLI